MDEDVKKLMEIKYTSTLAAHDKAVWNEAIEACIEKLKQDFVAPNVVISLLRELRK